MKPSGSRRAARLLALVAAAAWSAACQSSPATSQPASVAASQPASVAASADAESDVTAAVHVLNSGGFTSASLDLIPEFEKITKKRVVMEFGPSMGVAPEAIPNRLARGEAADVVIMVGAALDGLVKNGEVVADSKVDLARSRIGVAVRAGATKPDIATVEALKKTLLNAKSIAYSDSASGTYVSTVLLERLGIADQVAGKCRRVQSERVGKVVARGEAEIGFQQISELLPVPGIDYVGPIPAEVQHVTVFSAGVTRRAKEPEGARALIRFFASKDAAPDVVKSGLDPIGEATAPAL